ncbi:MAG: hypothetical protein LBO82_09240 [Synergistaceae bacterium]|nr:hypothetical protein [Synergistaceae bacterium]
MKKTKSVVILVLLLTAVCSVLPAEAWDSAKQKNLGQDAVKMQWYLLDYGTENGVPYAIARKYYTSESVKQQTIDLLMSKYGLAPDLAGGIYFTEYRYEYTPDGKQFAVAYLKHYDMQGEEIHGIVYDGSSEAAKKVFAPIDPKHATGKGSALAVPKAAPKTAAKKAPAKKK